MNIFKRLKRPLAAGSLYIAELDGLRFVAIAWVVFGHLDHIGNYQFPSWVEPFLNAPSLGVELFFVISGYVICMPFLCSQPKLKSYYLRRLRRIEPPFLICIVLLLLSQYIRGISLSDVDSWLHALATISYTHGIFYSDMSPVNSVTWSLEVEVVFYVVAPFVARAFLLIHTPWKRSASVLLMGLLCAFAAHPFREHFIVYKWLFGNVCFFFAGIAIAAMPKMRKTYYWDAVGLFGVALMAWVVLGALDHVALNMLGWFGVCAGTLKGKILKAILSIPPFPIIGGMCYTIYLFHFPILRQLIKLPYLSKEGSLICFAAIAVISLACCTGLYFLIERPFMRRSHAPK